MHNDEKQRLGPVIYTGETGTQANPETHSFVDIFAFRVIDQVNDQPIEVSVTSTRRDGEEFHSTLVVTEKGSDDEEIDYSRDPDLFIFGAVTEDLREEKYLILLIVNSSQRVLPLKIQSDDAEEAFGELPDDIHAKLTEIGESMPALFAELTSKSDI